MAVTVVAMVTSVNDYKKESQFIALNKFNDSKNVITVKRGGVEMEVNFDDLKCGDLARIKTGMQIPCDALLVPESSGVLTDEAAMTGESDEMKKDTPDMCITRRKEFLDDEAPGNKRGHHDVPSPLLLSGTQISTGEGWFLIIVVGKNSAIGIINAKISQKGAEMTPL